MGRGRQKAKQTKVARDLKYYSPPTDLTALQRELQSSANDRYDDAEYDAEGAEDVDDDTWSPSAAPRSARRR
ncbi:DUF3073 domain-containing protein [Brachybacterium nesterenkovii]|uniref:DUF3073 domain-containing protein n=1 Tax=Brachybacterium nesterenkovii TaxID=47847 RepID=A0A1X6X1R6_9MICO|nr:DUF3073 domain-containing protein [Brachybacterium nesterenkovii]SLM92420.1 hypothetical protein FM110_08205 [Brachybacterium nesterenkovii]